MRWEDISETGSGTYRHGSREEYRRIARVTAAVLDIIAAQPRFAGNPFVFAGIGADHIGGVSKRKGHSTRRPECGLDAFTISAGLPGL